MPAKIGRNAPCPCGSGRKYKACCLRGAEESLGRVAYFQAMDRRLVSQMLGFALEWFGAEFRAAADFEGDISPRGYDLSLFGHWAAFVHKVDDRTVLEWFLEERGDALASAERMWLADQADAWFSIWAVQDEQGRHACRLQDLMTGRERLVTMDGSLSRAPGVALLGRVVTHGDLSLLAGVHPRTLRGPTVAEAVLRLREAIGKGPGPVLPEALRSEASAGQLLVTWADLVEQTDRGTPGGPVAGVMICSDRYLAIAEVRDDGAIAAALDSIPGAERTLEDEPGTTGWEFREDPGDPESRMLANAELNRTGLVVLGGSEEELDRMREAIERAAGALLRHDRRHVVRRSDLLRREMEGAPEGDDEAEEREPHSPAEAAGFRSLKERYYAEWPDTPQPFLDGMTPKAAMAVPRFRRHIEDILEDMEVREGVVPEEVRVDLAPLRRGLGLEAEEE